MQGMYKETQIIKEAEKEGADGAKQGAAHLNMETLRTLGLPSTAAPPFPSKLPEITPYLPPVSSTGTSLSILSVCRAVYDALHNVTELSPVPVACCSLPCP